MGATLLAEPEKETRDSEKEAHQIADLLRPDLLVDGHEPEMRVMHFGLSWERYLAADKALGDDRPGPRFYYLEGALEITTTSGEHERVKEWVGGFVDLYFDEAGIEFVTRGQATMRLSLEQAGAEPDKSWCIGGEKEFPDLVFEVALTSGGVRKLELYRRFAVREVWFWQKRKLEIFALLPDATGYEKVGTGSQLLPSLDIALLERCLSLPTAREARRAFREGLAAGR